MFQLKMLPTSLAIIPDGWQWAGLVATFAGTLFALWAALSAKRAGQRAEEAKDVAFRVGRVLQLSDLIDDLKEIQSMLARAEFQSIAAKASHLRGRVVRFRIEAYNELGNAERLSLATAREHLVIIGQEAVNRRLADVTRVERIQVAFGNLVDALNRVFALLRADTME